MKTVYAKNTHIHIAIPSYITIYIARVYVCRLVMKSEIIYLQSLGLLGFHCVKKMIDFSEVTSLSV